MRIGRAKDFRRRVTVLGVTMGLVGSMLAGTARADYGPVAYDPVTGKGDIVGVGSDTLQYIGEFLADGFPAFPPAAGGPGFNGAGNKFKWVSFDATADANGRASYLNGSTPTVPKNLNPTILLRKGLTAIQRPNGSFAGLNALLADNANNRINIARSSRPPTAAEQASAAAKGWTCLKVIEVAHDPLKFAVNNTTNAPAGISINQMVTILQDATGTINWTAVGGTSTNVIHPVVPQAGSGTRSSFLADLQAANGDVPVNLVNPNIITAEEHDPTAITGSTSPPDTIAPFSEGRLNLYNKGYFHDPTVPFPGGPSLIANIQLLNGAASDGNPSYNNNRPLYFVFRDSDKNAPQPAGNAWQPGGNLNWVNQLFLNALLGYTRTAAGQAAIAAAGVTPTPGASQDKGCLSG